MDDSKWERWGALGGILFAVLVTISGILPGSPPKTSDSALKIANFLRDQESEIRWSTYIGALSTIPLFWWLGSVWRLMRRSEGGSPRLAVSALAGAVFAATMAAVGGVVLAALPLIGLGKASLDNSDARAFYIISTNLATVVEIGIAVFLGAFSIVIIRSRVLPAVMGWLGVLLALVGIVGAATVATTRDAIFDVAFAGFFGFGLWILVVSILMLRVGGREPAAAPAPAASAA